MKDSIPHSTEELYNRYLSGEKVKDISIQTGLSTSCIYKRFQRFRKIKQQMQVNAQNEDAEEIEFTEQTILQSENSDWEEDVTAALLSFVMMFLGVFLYQEYDVKKIMIGLKKDIAKMMMN